MNGNPWYVPEDAAEDTVQAALFNFMQMAISWGLPAAFDQASWEVKLHASKTLAARGRGLTDDQTEQLTLLHAIPNGAEFARGSHSGASMRAKGLTAGVPDIFLPVPKHGFAGFYLELKSPTGKLNQAQRIMIPKLRKQGYRVDDTVVGWRNAGARILTYLEVPTP